MSRKKSFPKLIYTDEFMLRTKEGLEAIAIADLTALWSQFNSLPKFVMKRADKYGPEIVRRWNSFEDLLAVAHAARASFRLQVPLNYHITKEQVDRAIQQAEEAKA
jgi:hypothetical protein